MRPEQGDIRARGQRQRSRDVCRDDEGTVGCGRNVTGVAKVLNSCGREQEDRGGHLGGVGLREPGRRGEKSGRPSLPQPDPATEGPSRFFKPTLHSGDRNAASCSFPGWRWKTLVTFRRARRFLPAPFSLTECEGSDRGWAPGGDRGPLCSLRWSGTVVTPGARRCLGDPDRNTEPREPSASAPRFSPVAVDSLRQSPAGRGPCAPTSVPGLCPASSAPSLRLLCLLLRDRRPPNPSGEAQRVPPPSLF